MTSQPRPLAQLQRAIRTGNLPLALSAAPANMPRVPLEDAFVICVILRDDRRRYERARVRWLERFAAEAPGATLADVQVIADGFRKISAGAAPPDVRSLTQALRRHELDRAADRLRDLLEPAVGAGRCEVLAGF